MSSIRSDHEDSDFLEPDDARDKNVPLINQMVLQDNEPSIRDLDTASTIVDAEEPVLCEGGPVFNDVLMPEFIK